MNTFTDMLKYLRQREGLSQRELAQKLHMSHSAISMYESGRRFPEREAEEAIADFFNVSLNTLRGISEEPVRPDKALGELFVQLRHSPRAVQLVKDFMELNEAQQESILALIRNMKPIKQ